MGYNIEHNCLLVVPNQQLDLSTLKAGDKFTVVKDGARLYPLNIAIEVCDKDTYNFYGKVAVRKLTLEANTTTLDVEVLKVFSQEESDTFTRNFIKPDHAS